MKIDQIQEQYAKVKNELFTLMFLLEHHEGSICDISLETTCTKYKSGVKQLLETHFGAVDGVDVNDNSQFLQMSKQLDELLNKQI